MSSEPMNYREAWEYLDGLQFFKIKLRLESMAELLGRLGHPERDLRIIHVAGTNGKGSVAATITAILGAAGLKAGLYTSPHLGSVRERFRVGDEYIPREEFAREAGRIRAVLAEGQITYFEFTTALALLWFARRRADAVVLEVGLGGRLDATNVVTPLVSIITNVSMDHEQYLGTTLAEIAAEKSGIVKPGVPVVAGRLRPEAREVISDICARKKAPLHQLGRDFVAEGGSAAVAPAEWEYRGLAGTGGERPLWRGLPCVLAGAHQLDNGAVALAAVDLLCRAGWPIAEEHVRRGLAQVRWPGRLEEFWRDTGGVVRDSPPESGSDGAWRHYLLDGAHNPDGVEALCRHLEETAPRRLRLILVWAAMADKDLGRTLPIIAPLADRILLTRPASERAADPHALRALLPPEHRRKARVCPAVAEALETAAGEADAADLICVAGSLYLIGAAREFLRGPLAP